MGLTNVDQSQHHHNEGLKQNNQNVEEQPAQTGDEMSNHTENT